MPDRIARAFGFPDRGVNMPADIALANEIANVSSHRGVRTGSLVGSSLAHGATVPFWFVAEANWPGPIVVLGLNSLGRTSLVTFGEIIAEGSHLGQMRRPDPQWRCESPTLRGRTFRVRLTWTGLRPMVPGDRAARQLSTTLLRCDPGLETEAVQDALDSALVPLAATGFSATGTEVLSYEGPFGASSAVGILYGEAFPVPADHA